MKKNDSLNVYERPEAEELKLDFESSFLSGDLQDPDDPGEEIEL